MITTNELLEVAGTRLADCEHLAGQVTRRLDECANVGRARDVAHEEAMKAAAEGKFALAFFYDTAYRQLGYLDEE